MKLWTIIISAHFPKMIFCGHPFKLYFHHSVHRKKDLVNFWPYYYNDSHLFSSTFDDYRCLKGVWPWRYSISDVLLQEYIRRPEKFLWESRVRYVLPFTGVPREEFIRPFHTHPQFGDDVLVLWTNRGGVILKNADISGSLYPEVFNWFCVPHSTSLFVVGSE